MVDIKLNGSVTSNIDELMNKYLGIASTLSHPIQATVYNNSPQARWLEYGGTKNYNRKNPHTKKMRNTRTELPKGGYAIRWVYKTRVVQPPKAMVRLSRKNIEAYGKRLLKSRGIAGRGDYVTASNQIALYAKAQIVLRSPQAKGHFRKNWKINSAK